MLSCGPLCLVRRQVESTWPLDVMTCFMEDFLGPRVWCDATNCKLLVDNLQCSLRAKPPLSRLITSGTDSDSASATTFQPGNVSLAPSTAVVGADGVVAEVCNRYPIGPSHTAMRSQVNRLLRTRMSSGLHNYGQSMEAVMAVVQTSVTHLTEALRTTVQYHGYRMFSKLAHVAPTVAVGMLQELDDANIRLLPAGLLGGSGCGNGSGSGASDTSTLHLRGLRPSDVVVGVVLGSVVRALVVEAHLHPQSNVAPASVTPQALAKVTNGSPSYCGSVRC